MSQDNDFITKENLRAIAGEEWLKILRDELGDDAPATLADVRAMVQETIHKKAFAIPDGVVAVIGTAAAKAAADAAARIVAESVEGIDNDSAARTRIRIAAESAAMAAVNSAVRQFESDAAIHESGRGMLLMPLHTMARNFAVHVGRGDDSAYQRTPATAPARAAD